MEKHLNHWFPIAGMNLEDIKKHPGYKKGIEQDMRMGKAIVIHSHVWEVACHPSRGCEEMLSNGQSELTDA